MKNIEGLLIKKNREKLGFKQEYLCKDICSVSYLSKIEKGDITASDEVVKLLFKKLGIEYNNDIKFVEEGQKLLYNISKSNYFGLPVEEETLKEAREKREEFLNSPLHIEYELFQLFDSLYGIENIIEHIDILKYKDYMNNDQLYKAYLITGFINNDINMLENAKRIKSTPEVLSQIAYIKWTQGKYYEAIELYLKALSLANNEGNIKEQIDICIMLGNIYMDIHIPTMQKYYDKALLLSNFAPNSKFKYFIYYHMGIAYTSSEFGKSKEYLLQALKLCDKENKDSLEKIYQKLCFLHLYYNNRNEVENYYNKAKEINILKEVNELIGIMIDDKDYIHLDLYLNKLEDIYNTSKKHNKHSNTKYYGDFLIEAYKANRKYKDALSVTDYLYRNQA